MSIRHFKNLRRANLWRRRHPKRIVTDVTVTSKAPPPVPSKRQLVVRFCHWGVLDTAAIHYAQIRPIPSAPRHVFPPLPFTTDCSGFVTMAYRYAGAADPNGLRYNGTGNTATLLRHMKHIAIGDVRAGDVVVYGVKSVPAGHHAAVVTAVHGGTPALIETVSHGGEAGPMLISVAQEAKYQPDGLAGIVYLSQLA